MKLKSTHCSNTKYICVSFSANSIIFTIFGWGCLAKTPLSFIYISNQPQPQPQSQPQPQPQPQPQSQLQSQNSQSTKWSNNDTRQI